MIPDGGILLCSQSFWCRFIFWDGQKLPGVGQYFSFGFWVLSAICFSVGILFNGGIIMNRQMLFRYIIIFIGIVLLAQLTSCFETSTIIIVNREEIEDQRREAERKAELEAKFRRPSFVRPKLNLGK